jgi:hypothetical protein
VGGTAIEARAVAHVVRSYFGGGHQSNAALCDTGRRELYIAGGGERNSEVGNASNA